MAKQVEAAYGNALFELSKEQNNMDVLYEEAVALIGIFEENEDLIKLLAHPQISKEEKLGVLSKTFEGRVSKDMSGLMAMVVEKGHVPDMTGILKCFVKLVKDEKRIGVARVTSAIDLTDSQKKAIERKLISTTKYETMEIEYIIDKDIIGGLIIRIEDRVVDSSIRTKLKNMSAALSQAVQPV